MVGRDQGLEPGPGDGVGRQQGGEVKGGTGGRIEQGKRGAEDDPELLALVEHLLAHIGMGA